MDPPLPAPRPPPPPPATELADIVPPVASCCDIWVSEAMGSPGGGRGPHRVLLFAAVFVLVLVLARKFCKARGVEDEPAIDKRLAAGLTSDLGGPPPIFGDCPSGLAVDEGGSELWPLLVGGTAPEFLSMLRGRERQIERESVVAVAKGTTRSCWYSP